VGKLLWIAGLACVLQAALLAEEPLVWQAGGTPESYVELRAGGRPILRYNYGVQLPPGVPEDRARCCYIYPLWTPGGVSVLDDFPKDHYHHRGLFWAWPDVRLGGVSYDGWMMKGLKTVHKRRAFGYQEVGGPTTLGAILRVENEWVIGSKTVAKVQEKYEIDPSVGQSRTVKVTLTLTATDAPLVLRGSHEDGKSYGGLSVRFAPRTDTVIRTEKGVSEKDEDLNAHDWAELEAVYDGHKAALRIDNAAANEGGSPQWCLRHYGFLGAAFPGKTRDRDDFTLESGKPLTLRYSILLSDR
jgi:hypothetical protein